MVEIIVMRCAVCGDTFPAHPREEPVCRSCGSSDVAAATEPLL